MTKYSFIALSLALAVASCSSQPEPTPTGIPTVAPPRPAVTQQATGAATGTPTHEPTAPSSTVLTTPSAAATPTAPSATPTVQRPASPSVPPLQPTPQDTEESDSTVPLGIAEHNTYTDEYGDLHVVGLVTNASTTSITDPSVLVQLIDNDGHEVSEAEATVMLVGLAPGGSLPFEAIVPSPPDFKDVRFTAKGYAAEPDSMPISELKVTNGTIQKAEDSYVVKGRVQNLSSKVLSMVSLAVVVRDASGKIVGVGSTDLGDPLAPSAAAEFEMELMDLGGSPASLEFWAEGYAS